LIVPSVDLLEGEASGDEAQGWPSPARTESWNVVPTTRDDDDGSSRPWLVDSLVQRTAHCNRATTRRPSPPRTNLRLPCELNPTGPGTGPAGGLTEGGQSPRTKPGPPGAERTQRRSGGDGAERSGRREAEGALPELTKHQFRWPTFGKRRSTTVARLPERTPCSVRRTNPTAPDRRGPRRRAEPPRGEAVSPNKPNTRPVSGCTWEPRRVRTGRAARRREPSWWSFSASVPCLRPRRR
jgi:hypothetical protein